MAGVKVKRVLIGGPADGAEIEIPSDAERVIVPQLNQWFKGRGPFLHQVYELDSLSGRMNYAGRRKPGDS